MSSVLNIFNFRYTYNDIEDIKRFLQKIVTIEPTIGIICGSGLGEFSNFCYVFEETIRFFL